MSRQLFPSPAFRRSHERAPGLWLATDDNSLVPLTGQTPTFVRASGQTVLDSTGAIATGVHSQPSTGAWINSDGRYEPVIELGNAYTNLCLRSEDFGTTWAAIATPTRTAAAKRNGDVALDLLGDNDSGGLEGYSQVITFTGNAVKAVSLFLAPGTSTSFVIRLRDTTAGANRLLAAVTWSGGAPSVAMTTGVHIAQIVGANGVYRLLFQTTSVTAANTNQIEVYPATNASLVTSSTGTTYVGGVQCENNEYARGYVKTLGTTQTCNAEVLSYALAMPVADFTVYLRVARPTWGSLAGTLAGKRYLAWLGPTGSAGAWYIDFLDTARSVEAAIEGASATQAVTQSIPNPSMFDICAQFQNVATAATVRLDVGSGFGSVSSSAGAVSAWAGSTLYLGNTSAGNLASDTGIRRIVIAPGARTLAELKGMYS